MRKFCFKKSGIFGLKTLTQISHIPYDGFYLWNNNTFLFQGNSMLKRTITLDDCFYLLIFYFFLFYLETKTREINRLTQT